MKNNSLNVQYNIRASKNSSRPGHSRSSAFVAPPAPNNKSQPNLPPDSFLPPPPFSSFPSSPNSSTTSSSLLSCVPSSSFSLLSSFPPLLLPLHVTSHFPCPYTNSSLPPPSPARRNPSGFAPPSTLTFLSANPTFI
ncbi:hypothetical protein BJX99DRAFT_183731 [Aspergillus californicus]